MLASGARLYSTRSNRPFHFLPLALPRAQSLLPTLFIKCTFNFFVGTIIHHPRGVIRLGSEGRARFRRRGRITNREIRRKMAPPVLPLARINRVHGCSQELPLIDRPSRSPGETVLPLPPPRSVRITSCSFKSSERIARNTPEI